jgi:integrase
MGAIREITKKDGTTTYHAEVRLKGQKPQRASFRTRTLAKKWIQDTESAIRDGRHFRTAESKRHTAGETIDKFMKEWSPKYHKYEAKQNGILIWWKKEIGHLVLADLLPTSIAVCRDKLLNGTTYRKTQRSGSTVNRYLAALSKVLTVAVKEWQWLPENPMSKVSKPSESRGRNRFLSEEEIGRLLEACSQSANPYLESIVRIALISGMRLGEIMGLRWSDIDFDQQTICLEKTKNDDRRILPLIGELESIFKKCSTYGSGGYVFPARHSASLQPIASIRSAFQKSLQDSGIENFKFHDLRHTACSHMAMNGASQGELMEILGHRSPRMTSRYRHYDRRHIANVMERTQANLLKGGQDGAVQ